MVNRQRFLVRFWGVRGSYPTPGQHTLRYGGNTACVEVQAGEQTLILDAGSGIIRLGNDIMQRSEGTPRHLTLLISHVHSDHLMGIPFFLPIFQSDTQLDLIGPTMGGQEVGNVVTTVMSPPYFPVDIRTLPSQRTFYNIAGGQCITWPNPGGQPDISGWQPKRSKSKISDELHITTRFTNSHPLNGTLMYRIEYAGKCVIYATDVEWEQGCTTDTLEFFSGADLLIHDAQYTANDYEKTRHGFGHCTVAMATEAARDAGVKELILFHHEPTYDDDQLDAMAEDARTRFAATRSACEGMEIDLLV